MSGSGSGREVGEASLLDAVVPLGTLAGLIAGSLLLFSLVLSALYGFTGFKIWKVEPTMATSE